MDPISNFFFRKIAEKFYDSVKNAYDSVKNTKAERFQWKPVLYEKIGGGGLNEPGYKGHYGGKREQVLNWIQQHVRYEKSTIFNDSPVHVKDVRRFYEMSGIGYLTTTDMANALIEAGFDPVGSNSVGWYFEVKVIDVDNL